MTRSIWYKDMDCDWTWDQDERSDPAFPAEWYLLSQYFKNPGPKDNYCHGYAVYLYVAVSMSQGRVDNDYDLLLKNWCMV